MRYHKDHPETLDADWEIAEALSKVEPMTQDNKDSDRLLYVQVAANAFMQHTTGKSPEQLGDDGLKRAEILFNHMLKQMR